MKPGDTTSGLRLYLDECSYSKKLYRLLTDPPRRYQVAIPAQAGLIGASDLEHFNFAREHGLIVVTANPSDFERLHPATPDHHGILGIHYSNDRIHDIADEDIARAIDNLLAADVPFAGQFYSLNAWRYARRDET